MKLLARASKLLLVVGLLGLVTNILAQTRPAPRFKPNPRLSEQERRGEHWFLQRCSVCHLAVFSKDDPAGLPAIAGGPSLEGLLKGAAPEKEPTVREFILRGTPNMPGFQYSLEPKMLDDLIAYLKTL